MAIDTESKVKIQVDVEMDEAVRQFERLKKAQEQAAAQTKLVGDKFNELGKSMVGLQMNETFNRLSKSVNAATDGMVDLNAAFAGYQAAGVYGAAIGGLAGGVIKLGDALGELDPGPVNHVKDALHEYELGHIKATDKVRQFLDEQSKLATQFRQDLFQAFKAGVKSAKEYEDSMKDVIATSKSLIANIDKIKAATGYLSPVDQAVQDLTAARTNRQNSAGRKLFGGFADGVTGKTYKTEKGDESDAQRKQRLRGYVGTRGTESLGIENEVGGVGGEFSLRGILSGLRGQKASENLDEFGRQRDGLSNLNNELQKTAAWKAQLATSRASSKSFLEETFGKVDEISGYKLAFDGLSSAVVAGYGAMVDGTMSFGQAFKKTIADALKSTGSQMVIEALKETAYGIASLARYDYGGAALHFKSAAAFGVGAVAAGLAASALGGGGSSSASAGGAASTGGSSYRTNSSGGFSSPPPSTSDAYYHQTGPRTQAVEQGPIYVIATNPFRVDDTPRMKRNMVNQFTALGGSGFSS